MKFTNKVLINLKGEPLKQGTSPQEQLAPDAPVLTAFDVFIQAALMPASVRQYSANESAARYTVCIELYKAMEADYDAVLIVGRKAHGRRERGQR